MTLINNKEPSLDVAKKRPITVTSVMLSMVTKIEREENGSVTGVLAGSKSCRSAVGPQLSRWGFVKQSYF